MNYYNVLINLIDPINNIKKLIKTYPNLLKNFQDNSLLNKLSSRGILKLACNLMQFITGNEPQKSYLNNVIGIKLSLVKELCIYCISHDYNTSNKFPCFHVLTNYHLNNRDITEDDLVFLYKKVHISQSKNKSSLYQNLFILKSCQSDILKFNSIQIEKKNNHSN